MLCHVLPSRSSFKPLPLFLSLFLSPVSFGMSLALQLMDACCFRFFFCEYGSRHVVIDVCCFKKKKTDSSSFSDKKQRERKPAPAPERTRVTPSVLKRNNSIKKAMRPDIEQTFVSKLEKLGVKSVSSCRSIFETMSCAWERVTHRCFSPMAPPGSGRPQEQRVELPAGQSGFSAGGRG